jgi:DNA-binding response OmpR family regulator
MITGPRILLVEPNSARAAEMTHSIEARMADASVLDLPEPHEALRLLRERRHDCAIVDQQLPNLDGLKFLELLRQFDLNLPVIMVAARMSEQQASEAINFGASEYLVAEGSYHLILPRLIAEAIRRQTLIRRNRELEERLKESENLSAFRVAAATLAHEISNPLTTIIGVSELLKSDDRLSDQKGTRRKLRLIASSADRIKTALNRMSSLSQPTVHHTDAGPLVEIRTDLSSKKPRD